MSDLALATQTSKEETPLVMALTCTNPILLCPLRGTSSTCLFSVTATETYFSRDCFQFYLEAWLFNTY